MQSLEPKTQATAPERIWITHYASGNVSPYWQPEQRKHDPERDIAEFTIVEYVRADANRARITELEAALKNLLAWETSAFTDIPPYGHDCRWCIRCVARVIADARAALAKGEVGKD